MQGARVHARARTCVRACVRAFVADCVPVRTTRGRIMMNRSPQSGEWRMALALKFPPRVGNVRQRLVCDAFVSPNLVGTAVPLIGAGVSPSLAVAAVPLAEHTGLAGSKPAPVRCEFKYTWVVGTEHQRRHRREVERCAGGVAVGLQAEVARSGDLASQLLFMAAEDDGCV